MDATEVSVGTLPRPPAGRPRSSNWTRTGEPAKEFDTPAGGRRLEKLFTSCARILPAAFRLRIAPCNPAADGHFRRKQAGEQADRRGNCECNTHKDMGTKSLELSFQAIGNCCDAARTVFPACHEKLRSLIRA
jgi:hypothetical protein